MIVIFVIAFMLGGAFFVYLNENSSLAENGNRNSDSIAKVDNRTAALLPSMGGTMSVADITEKASPAIVNIQSQIKVTSVPSSPFFNDPFFRDFLVTNLKFGLINVMKLELGPDLLFLLMAILSLISM